MPTAVIRDKGKKMPNEFRDLILEKHSSGFGYASPQGENINVQSFLSTEVDLKDTIQQLEESYKDDRIFYIFGTDQENLQPFGVLTNGEEGEAEEIYVSALVEGEFQGYETAKEFVENYLVPLMGETWEAANSEIEAFMKGVKDARNTIAEKFGARASLTVIPFVGDCVEIAKNTEGSQFPWGYVTRTHGYTEQAPSAPAEGKKTITIKKPGSVPAVAAKEEHPPGGTKVTLEEKYAPLLKHKDGPAVFKIYNGALWCERPKGANMDRTKKWWEDHYQGDKPKDPKLLFLGFPADRLKPSSPLVSLRSKLMGDEPKKADHIQKPEEKEKVPIEETKEMSLLIPKEHKDKYLALKEKGKIRFLETTQLLKYMASYPAASVQMGETAGEMLYMDPVSFTNLPEHMKVVVWSEARNIALDLQSQLDEQKPAEKPAEPPADGKKTITIKKPKAA